jgi:glycosyltransferase involved in cell wall biosynthesis
MGLKNVALLNPIVPHYREEFFGQLAERIDLDIYVYEDKNTSSSFNVSALAVKKIRNSGFLSNRFIIYDIFPLLSKKYDTLVLMLHFGHLSTWFLLLTRIFHRKKVILWGQGISVKRYLQEQKRPNFLFRLMIGLSNGVWLYTEKEHDQWRRIFPKKPMTALNNTISSVDDILDVQRADVLMLKTKYNIIHQTCLIFCARFDNPHRRVDLLVKSIELLDPARYGFIIIGDGKFKPDFSNYQHVYDFGTVYDREKKDELFAIADIFYQPGWIGLSVVEAMAYGKPILTYERSEEVLQCVEYGYIENQVNGILLKDFDDFERQVPLLSEGRINELGRQSKAIVRKKLTMKNMVKNALSVILE